MNNKREEISLKTREIYLNQHNNYLKDKITFDRFLNMVKDPAYFHLEQKDFEGKHILDAGCGNTGYFEVAMHELGVEHMTCLDLGSEWIEPLSTFLQGYGDEGGIKNIDYVSGSTDDLPFRDESFDMVFSNGVLPHLADVKQVEQAFSELARVTKPGGYLYIILGCPGGLVEEELLPALRGYYDRNLEFKKLIDNLTPDMFSELFKVINDGMKKNTGETFEYEKLDKLFDIDFCTSVQNIIQAPTRLIMELDEEFILSKFKEYNFIDVKQCKRFVKRENFRKFLAPLHYDTSNTYAKILYGAGNLEFIARKG